MDERDWWIEPTIDNIENGVLAADTYMTANNYANLKIALSDDLSGITDLNKFAISLNRNCFQGAYNFLITVILRYKPYVRIVAVEPAERRLRHACIKPGVHEGIVLQATDLREFDIRIRIHSVSAAETHFVAEVIAVLSLD